MTQPTKRKVYLSRILAVILLCTLLVGLSPTGIAEHVLAESASSAASKVSDASTHSPLLVSQAGTVAASKVYYTNKVAVLMYHDFKEDPKAKAISLKVFQEQLTTLTKNGFKFISMDEFKAFKLNKGKVPANAVLLTFDDGYEDFYTVAYPYLKEKKIPATNFLIVRSTDTGNPGGNPHITWDQMREMLPNKMSFYSHTYNQHFYIPNGGPALTSRYPAASGKRAETLAEYRKRVTDDLSLANKRIRDELGTKTDVFSYPYGAYTKETQAISAKVGHKLDVTIKPGLNGPAGTLVYRINAGYKSISGNDLITKIKGYTK